MSTQQKLLTQKELKETLTKGYELDGLYVDKIRFDSRISPNGTPYFYGADVTFKEGSADKVPYWTGYVDREPGRVYNFNDADLCMVMNRQFQEEGVTASPSDGVFLINFEMGTRMVHDTPIPVFKGISAEVEEYKKSMNMDEPADDKPVMKSLADIWREEMVQSLSQLDNEDIMGMVNAHFVSHPALPGEKSLKTMAIDELANDGYLSDEERQDMIQRFAQTRIRETKMDSSYEMPFSPSELKIETVSQEGTVSMGKVNANLMKAPDGNVYIEAETTADYHIMIGKLPDRFLTNNPMNVESCKAELQVTDYSNGKMKNVSMRVVADTDLMSGDIIDLDEDMLKDIETEQSVGMEQ